MAKYGPNVFRAHNAQLDSLIKSVTEELAAVRNEIDQVNKERKLQQLAAGRDLERNERDWFELVQKNLEIEGACRDLEGELSRLRQKVDQARQERFDGGSS